MTTQKKPHLQTKVYTKSIDIYKKKLRSDNNNMRNVQELTIQQVNDVTTGSCNFQIIKGLEKGNNYILNI